MEEREYNSIFSLANMFDSEYKLKEFLIFYVESLIRYCKKNKDNYYPFHYDSERQIFSFSYNFFVSCIAKAYDVGNKQTEEKINSSLKLMSLEIKNRADEVKKHKERSFVIISILQNYYGIIFPNNRVINTTFLKGNFTPQDSYYIPVIYEDKEKKPIQYETLPSKKNNLIRLGVPEELLVILIDYSQKKGLKNVAFNAKQCQKYWQESSYTKVLRFE